MKDSPKKKISRLLEYDLLEVLGPWLFVQRTLGKTISLYSEISAPKYHLRLIGSSLLLAVGTLNE